MTVWIVSNEYSPHSSDIPTTRILGVSATACTGIQQVSADLTDLGGMLWYSDQWNADRSCWFRDYHRSNGHMLERGTYIVQRYTVKEGDDE